MIHRFGDGVRRVLALHCALGSGAMWAGLDVPGSTVLAPDLPGHGDRPVWDGAGDYHTICTWEAIELAVANGPVDVVGHSLGATVALRLALERPELVRTLTLIEPVLFAAARANAPQEFAAYLVAIAPVANALRRGDMMVAADAFQAIWGNARFASQPLARREAVAARMPIIAASDGALAQDSAGLLAYMRLESLGIPVLLLQGSASPPIIAVIMAELARRLPQVTEGVIDGAGHMLAVTHAAQVSAAIAGFYGTSSMM